MQLASDFAARHNWQAAAAHWNGSGLQDGIQVAATMALHKHIPATIAAAKNHEVSEDLMDAIDREEWPPQSISWLKIFLCGGYWSD